MMQQRRDHARHEMVSSACYDSLHHKCVNGPGHPHDWCACPCHSENSDAQARLESDGSIIADAKGNPIPHPALAIERQCGEQLRKWGRRFEPRR